MARIIRPDTAFPLSSGKKRPRKEDKNHLDFIRSLPCLIGDDECDGRTEAAHIRAKNHALGKRETGKAEKPDDAWTVPLCSHHHREQHKGDEQTWWWWTNADPFLVALALWKASGDEEAGLLIIRENRP